MRSPRRNAVRKLMIRRLVSLVPTLLGVASLVFLLLHVVPGAKPVLL